MVPALLTACGKAVSSAPDTSAPAKKKKPLPMARIAARVADRLPHSHLSRTEFGDAIATNALALFIDTLDFDRSFFLASDVEEFRLQATQLDDQVRDGNTAFAQTIFQRYKERVINRTDYVQTLLDKGFDITIDETHQWKRDDALWAADEAEWDELWRKKIKSEYVGRVAAREAGTDKENEESAGSAATNLVEVAESGSTDTNLVETAEPAADEILTPEEFVRDRYKQYRLMVETNFDEENILARYLTAFAQSYDPHSAYLSPRGKEDFDIHMSQSLVGIGAMLRSDDGAAEITRVIPGGPADADGRLKAGDKIISVGQGDEESVNIMFWPLSKAVRLIRGEIGTDVVLTVIPGEDKTATTTKKIRITRAEVRLEEQAAKGTVYDTIGTNALPHRLGVVTVPEFYADFEALRKSDPDAVRVSADVRRILKEFSTNNVDGVIVDLRNDGGGSLPEAIEITGMFIPLGAVVQVRESRGVAPLSDGDPATLYRGPLVVLVNRLSASASEIVAAALQDYGRAVIVGDSKTHGKGTVQTVLPLSRLSDKLGSLKVTTASFYRIAGGSTQLKGVTPDIILPSLYDTLEVGEEFLDNALPWSRVHSAWYRPWSPSVKPLLPELLKRSGNRMEDNPAFKTYLARRDRLRERIDNPEISLLLTNRVKEILATQEMEDLQESMIPGMKDEGDNKEDPVLDETLLILSDLVGLSANKLTRIW